MQRGHLTAVVACIAAASILVAPRLQVGNAPPGEPAGPRPLREAPAPLPQSPPDDLPERPPRAVIRSVVRAEPAACHDTEVVVAHELSASVLEGRQLDPEDLITALHQVRESLPDRSTLGVVGFAQWLWSSDGATPSVDASPWLPPGSHTAMTLPDDVGAEIGTCANLELGLLAALHQLEASSATNRALWMVVDGLHDCDVNGRFAYTALTPIVERARALDIDVSVLIVDAWSERRGPTPLDRLVRGDGIVVHTPAWELEIGYRALTATVPSNAACP